MEKLDLVKLALMCAASGRHNIILVGPAGCGKTIALQRLADLLTPLTKEEAESVNRIKSLAGIMPLAYNGDEEWLRPPFRMPHMSASIEGMCGGGVRCMPGEISLAHNGVLFLDEAAEFRSAVLQMLRVPLESGKVCLSRAGRTTIYPADFQLAMTTNPCPCGNYGSKKKVCLCSMQSVELYWKKFSAPLLDRVDIILYVDAVENLAEEMEKWDWDAMRANVLDSVEKQRARGHRNGRLPVEKLDKAWLNFSDDAWNKAQRFVEKYDWSPRRKAICVKLAKTIADLFGCDSVSEREMDLACDLCKKIDIENINK